MATKGGLLYEGKTKKVFGTDDPALCVFEMKNDVTMHDDPSQTIILPGKGGWSNVTTCCMFEVLNDARVPVAFQQQLSATELGALLCTMISLEMVARRVARGSYCQRHPGTENTRFDQLVVEFYLKTSGAVYRHFNGATFQLPMPKVPKKGGGEGFLDDPLITNPHDVGMWQLRHPHLPLDDPQSLLSPMVKAGDVLPPNVTATDLENLTRAAFISLEEAWAVHKCELHDIKFEFGVGTDKVLYLADVVDADSWRMLDPKREEMSKQLARDGHPHPAIAAKYRQAAEMAQQVRDTVLSA